MHMHLIFLWLRWIGYELVFASFIVFLYLGAIVSKDERYWGAAHFVTWVAGLYWILRTIYRATCL